MNEKTYLLEEKSSIICLNNRTNWLILYINFVRANKYFL